MSTLPLPAQNPVGDYFRTAGNPEEHLIAYTLTLNADGSFLFHAYRNHKKGIPWEEHKYGKGSWTIKDKIVSFVTDPEKDIDEKHSLNFSGSRARFITKSPRDKTDRVIPTRLQFFESEIFWVARMKIFKN